MSAGGHADPLRDAPAEATRASLRRPGGSPSKTRTCPSARRFHRTVQRFRALTSWATLRRGCARICAQRIGRTGEPAGRLIAAGETPRGSGWGSHDHQSHAPLRSRHSTATTRSVTFAVVQVVFALTFKLLNESCSQNHHLTPDRPVHHRPPEPGQGTRAGVTIFSGRSSGAGGDQG